MKKLNHTVNSLLREIPLDDLFELTSYLSDISVAVIILNLPSDLSFELLNRFSDEKRNLLVKSIIELDNIAEGSLNTLLKKVESQIIQVLDRKYNQINAKTKLAELICRFGCSQRTTLLSFVKETKVSDFNRLKRRILEYKQTHGIQLFEDIISVRDEEVQLNIRKIDMQVIAVALSDSPEIIKNKLFRNLSSRMQELLNDEIAGLRDITPEQVVDAQVQIVDALMQSTA